MNRQIRVRDSNNVLVLLLQPSNGLFSRTTWVSRYQKGKTNLDFTRAGDSEWQWHQLGHMQVCTSLQTDGHASTPPISFLQPFLPPNQQCQSTDRMCKTEVVSCKLGCSVYFILISLCLQCFDAVGWVTGRALACKKLSGWVLAWLSV